jgi:hypothetical protein
LVSLQKINILKIYEIWQSHGSEYEDNGCWYVSLCSAVDRYQHFGGTWYFHLRVEYFILLPWKWRQKNFLECQHLQDSFGLSAEYSLNLWNLRFWWQWQ